jgi:hypothetical protein
MTQRWWVAIVAAAGIALAILLFPRPDTGDDAAALAEQPPTAPRAPPVIEGGRPGGPPPDIEPGRMIQGPRPDQAEALARRATPEATYANLLIGPVSSFKYTIRKQGATPEEYGPIEDRVDAVVAELREVRNDPAARPWSEIEATVNDLIALVTASEYGSSPDVTRSVERARMLLEQYHTSPAGPAPTGPTTASGMAPPSGTAPPSGANEPQELEE